LRSRKDNGAGKGHNRGDWNSRRGASVNLGRRRALFAVGTFLSCGFRPFFLGAALWSAGALALWITILIGGAVLPSRFDALTWHIHEMLFGFVMAAMAGFLLTAVANWTGRPPVGGPVLAALALLWLIGRLACLGSALMPPAVAVAADLAFPTALVAVVARELLLARSWRNLRLIVPLIVLGVANLFMHLAALGIRLPAGLGWRLGLSAIVVLMSVIAGRIVPTFTGNWLRQRGQPIPAGASPRLERLALGSLHLGFFAWAFAPTLRAVGVVLLLAAAFNARRLTRWSGPATLDEPLLWVLHLSYLWLVLGTAMLGIALLGDALPAASAIHALTGGAIGTMIMAVMTRATRGHTGRALRADRSTAALYTLVTLAALTRVAAALAVSWSAPLLVASALLWIAGFVGFVLRYGPMLLGPRVTAPP
jgi:uncharacterized protein involved in response to NO